MALLFLNLLWELVKWVSHKTLKFASELAWSCLGFAIIFGIPAMCICLFVGVAAFWGLIDLIPPTIIVGIFVGVPLACKVDEVITDARK